jgi:hypothetical protein
LLSDQNGAVFVEQLIVFLPVLYFALVAYQVIELCTANVIVKHAAFAAARAAVVVLPDNPNKYGGAEINQFVGQKKAAVRRAAEMILSVDPNFNLGNFSVQISGNSGNGPLTAVVQADFRCLASFVNIVCGGGSRRLSGTARDAYQGANYAY